MGPTLVNEGVSELSLSHLEPSLSDPADEFFSRKPDRGATVFFFLPGFSQGLLIRAQIWKRGRDI